MARIPGVLYQVSHEAIPVGPGTDGRVFLGAFADGSSDFGPSVDGSRARCRYAITGHGPRANRAEVLPPSADPGQRSAGGTIRASASRWTPRTFSEIGQVCIRFEARKRRR